MLLAAAGANPSLARINAKEACVILHYGDNAICFIIIV
jgi:hypothetical protein